MPRLVQNQEPILLYLAGSDFRRIQDGLHNSRSRQRGLGQVRGVALLPQLHLGKVSGGVVKSRSPNIAPPRSQSPAGAFLTTPDLQLLHGGALLAGWHGVGRHHGQGAELHAAPGEYVVCRGQDCSLEEGAGDQPASVSDPQDDRHGHGRRPRARQRRDPRQGLGGGEDTHPEGAGTGTDAGRGGLQL